MTEALFGFIGVIVGAFVPWFQSTLEGGRARRRDAQYLAIRLVCVLDKFLEDCAAAAADKGEEDQDGLTRAKVDSPDVPEFPADVDWRSIDPALMYSLLSFQNEVKAAEQAVSATWEWADPPDFSDFFESRTEKYGECGVRAAKLSQTLRSIYKIPPNKYPEWWNPFDVIQKELKALIERQRRREESNAALLANAPPPPSPVTEDKGNPSEETHRI
jgi:hypothetical protein